VAKSITDAAGSRKAQRDLTAGAAIRYLATETGRAHGAAVKIPPRLLLRGLAIEMRATRWKRSAMAQVMQPIGLGTFIVITNACPSARRILLPCLRALTVGLLCATASAQYAERGPNAGVSPPSIPADAKKITLKGEQVCLRRRPDAGGRVQLDCAIGFRGDDDLFYGLRAADPTRIDAFPQMNSRVVVTGMLIRSTDAALETSGQIVYTSIEPIREPKPVTGTFMCLLPDVPRTSTRNDCRHVIKTDHGLRWGLEELPAGHGLEPGDRIALEGDIVSAVSQDWYPWMSHSAPDRVEGVLLVRSLKTLPRR
jgi:hypothetical protein